MEARRLALTRLVGMSMIVVGIMAAVGVVGLTWLAASYGGLDYKCIVDGPSRGSAPFALTSEAVRVHGYFSMWPLGRACDWERADGQGFVTAGPGWTSTLVLLACVATTAVGAVFTTVGLTRTRFVAAKVERSIRNAY